MARRGFQTSGAEPTRGGDGGCHLTQEPRDQVPIFQFSKDGIVQMGLELDHQRTIQHRVFHPSKSVHQFDHTLFL
jgi:hypothetical protein